MLGKSHENIKLQITQYEPCSANKTTQAYNGQIRVDVGSLSSAWKSLNRQTTELGNALHKPLEDRNNWALPFPSVTKKQPLGNWRIFSVRLVINEISIFNNTR